jgi:hypothetical protein
MRGPEKRDQKSAEPVLTPEQLREDALVLSFVEAIGAAFIPNPPKKGLNEKWAKTLFRRDGMSVNARDYVLQENNVVENWWEDGKLHTHFHLALETMTIDGFSLGSISHRPGLTVRTFDYDQFRGKDAINKDVIVALREAARKREIMPVPGLGRLLRKADALKTHSKS